ncbi:C-X-C motif chemokine 10-like [Rhinatrema bivittatum]|uniref:C-X-C motif chemokine 10-like n=1 Tax=Rhinatrema bivittatum TaxID=194408 RepID=UPI00112C3ADF|nr:C-X-C motif chemokine 10-like [Rhinatrema bivittatum]
MDRRGALLLCSLLLIAAGIQGLSIAGKGRCLCTGTGSNFVRLIHIKKIEVYPQSSFCEHKEVIATMKQSGEKRCLNPNSEWVKRLLIIMAKRSSW